MAYLSDDELLDTEGGFTGWDDGTGVGAEETLEQALAEERLAELESELEQDEHPIDYEAELEDEEEEAAPVSDKRLKREMRAEAMKHAQEKLGSAAASEGHISEAKRQAEANLTQLYARVRWTLTVEWLDP